MFSILDRYIGKTILNMIGLTLFLLISLSGIIRFIEQLRRLKSSYDAMSAAFFSLLMVPKDLEVFFPIAALLGSLIGLGMLASKSELVVMETSGFSRIQIAKSVMKTSIPLVLIVMAITEWVAPVCEQMARQIRSERSYGGAMLTTQDSIWAKDGNNYVYIGKVNSDNSIANVNIYTVSKNHLVSMTHAVYGNYENNKWHLMQVEKSDFTNPNRIKNSSLLTLQWDSTITPEKLNIVAQNPDSLSISGLYQYSQYLSASGQDDSNYRLLFWKKLLKPLSVSVMMLLALSFIFGPLRSVSMGVRIITGIACGFLFYISDSVLSQITVVAGLPPFLGAIASSVIFLVICYLLFNRKA